jgi:hypothetical protein
MLLPALYAPLLGAQTRDLLSGLESVDVRVRFEGAAAGYPGLDAAEISQATRMRLQAAGLQVTDVTDAGQAPIFELLLVMYAEPDRPRYSFSVTASLTEGVLLRRGEARRVWAQTWSGGNTVGIVGNDGAALLRRDLDDLVEKFLRDYRTNQGERRTRASS